MNFDFDVGNPTKHLRQHSKPTISAKQCLTLIQLQMKVMCRLSLHWTALWFLGLLQSSLKQPVVWFVLCYKVFKYKFIRAGIFSQVASKIHKKLFMHFQPEFDYSQPGWILMTTSYKKHLPKSAKTSHVGMDFHQKTLPQKPMKQATMHIAMHAQTTHISQRNTFIA